MYGYSCVTTDLKHFHHSRKFLLSWDTLSLKTLQWGVCCCREKDQTPLSWLLPRLQVCPLSFHGKSDTGVLHLKAPVCLVHHTAEPLEAKLDLEINSNPDPNPSTNPSWRDILRWLQRPEDGWGVTGCTYFEIVSPLGHLSTSSAQLYLRLKNGDSEVPFRGKEKTIKICLESNKSQILRAGNHLIQSWAFKDR